MKGNRRFVVFILSHGRPDSVHTLKTLKSLGYSGDWLIVIDNEDETAERYYQNFGREKVVMFDKLAISKTFDTADTFEDRRTIVYARNACWDIAKERGYRYFLELDDDYTSFSHRYMEDGRLVSKSPRNINSIFTAMLDFLDDSGALTVAFAQGGDYIGGKDGGNVKKRLLRKAMNSFFCDSEKHFDFVGRVNEDVNTYTLLGQQGKLILTPMDFMLNQLQTQSNKGGMTGTYLDNGTYVKSFYSVIFSPSCVKLFMMGDKHYRIHHKVEWGNCTPKILSAKWKKGEGDGGKEENGKT